MASAQNALNVRSRQWFICVNQGAKCYPYFPQIMELLNENTSTWAYIKHKSEKSQVTGEEKPEHYHAILVFDNARAFSAIQRKFSGGHIERAVNVADCSAYLLHNTERAKADGKTVYEFKDIVTNNPDMLKIWLGDKRLKKPYFNPDRIVEYVVLDGLRGYTQFYMKYGAVVQKYMSSIKCICDEYYGNSVNNDWIDKLNTAKRNAKRNGHNLYSDSAIKIHITAFDSVYLFAQNINIFDLMIEYNKWELIQNDDFIEYVFNSRPDVVKIYSLGDLKGFGSDYIQEYLMTFTENAGC